MFDVSVVRTLGYYDAQAGQILREMGASNAGSYYDQDRLAQLDRWLVLHANAADKPRKKRRQKDTSLFASVRSGERIKPALLAHFARKAAAAGVRSGAQKGDAIIGYDCTFSAPKSVSLLALLGDDVQRKYVVLAHQKAVDAALKFAFDQGFVTTRRGHAGRTHEPAHVAASAIYTHFTSRADDPQLHSHAIVLNVCTRADGATAAVTNRPLLTYRAAIAAAYRATLAAELAASGDILCTRRGRNFEISGINPDIAGLFSKRRKDILAAAQKLGVNVSAERATAQILAKRTRAAKTKVQLLPVLQRRWHDELAAAGLSWASTMKDVQSAGSLVLDAATNEDIFRADASKQLAAHFAKSAFITLPRLMQIALEEAQGLVDVDAALRVIEDTKARLLPVSVTGREAQFLDPACLRLEHAMLRDADATRGSWKHDVSGAVESVVGAHAMLSDEQAEAVRTAFLADQIAVINGAAGAGKTFAIARMVEVAKVAELPITLLAPAWTAVDVVRTETGVSATRAHAVQGYVRGLELGRVRLSNRDVIILDEAGMASLENMEVLVRHVRNTGAKLILIGDADQLQPVAAGAPFSALSRLLTPHHIASIRRQNQSWMRRASMAFAAGDGRFGIEAYANAGCIHPVYPAASEQTRTRGSDDGMSGTFVRVIEQAADDYLNDAASAFYSTAILSGRLMVAARNQTVHALNHAVRQRLKARGSLGPEITISARPRDSEAPVALALAAGDRINFGEKLALGGVTIYNADVATINAISGDDDDAIEIVLDRKDELGNAITIRTTPTGLVRASGDKPPKLQHAYAVTIHAAQGRTVDRCVVVDAGDLSADRAYVAYTRHRHGLSVHVDAAAHLKPRDGQKDLSETDMRARLLTSMGRQSERRPDVRNPSDLVSDLAAWLASADPVKAFLNAQTTPKAARRLKAKLRLRAALPEPMAELPATDRWTRREVDTLANVSAERWHEAIPELPPGAFTQPLGSNETARDNTLAWLAGLVARLQRTLSLNAANARHIIRKRLGLLAKNPLARALMRRAKRLTTSRDNRGSDEISYAAGVSGINRERDRSRRTRRTMAAMAAHMTAREQFHGVVARSEPTTVSVDVGQQLANRVAIMMDVLGHSSPATKNAQNVASRRRHLLRLALEHRQCEAHSEAAKDRQTPASSAATALEELRRTTSSPPTPAMPPSHPIHADVQPSAHQALRIIHAASALDDQIAAQPAPSPHQPKLNQPAQSPPTVPLASTVAPAAFTPPKTRPVEAPSQITATARQPEYGPPISGETEGRRQTEMPDQRVPAPVVQQALRPETGATIPSRDQSGTDNAGETRAEPTPAQTPLGDAAGQGRPTVPDPAASAPLQPAAKPLDAAGDKAASERRPQGNIAADAQSARRMDQSVLLSDSEKLRERRIAAIKALSMQNAGVKPLGLGMRIVRGSIETTRSENDYRTASRSHVDANWFDAWPQWECIWKKLLVQQEEEKNAAGADQPALKVRHDAEERAMFAIQEVHMPRMPPMSKSFPPKAETLRFAHLMVAAQPAPTGIAQTADAVPALGRFIARLIHDADRDLSFALAAAAPHLGADPVITAARIAANHAPEGLPKRFALEAALQATSQKSILDTLRRHIDHSFGRV